MHFERILTILLHFLAGVPDRQYITILHLNSLFTFGLKKLPIPNLIYYFEKDDKSFLKRFSD
jgi:hypothetical protein